jgi:MFS family permease
MTGTLTWGITFSMFLFGGLADKWGARFALLAALVDIRMVIRISNEKQHEKI